MQTTNGKIEYTNTSIANQYSCTPNTLNAGNYYNFPAATAGSDNHTVTSNTEVLNSICPKGWRLPSYSNNKSYQNLLSVAYDLTTSTTTNPSSQAKLAPLSFIHSGWVNPSGSSLNHRGANGNYWLSTSHNLTNSRYLFFDGTSLKPQNSNSRANGYPIRCVSR